MIAKIIIFEVQIPIHSPPEIDERLINAKAFVAAALRLAPEAVISAKVIGCAPIIDGEYSHVSDAPSDNSADSSVPAPTGS